MGKIEPTDGVRAQRAALGMSEQERRRRIAAANQDHFERTRRSLVYQGHELGSVLPTAETEMKLRQDPLVRLVNNETITREQGRAGVEIREIFHTVSAGMLARCSTVERIGGGGGIPERVAVLHATRYKPWAIYLGGRAPEGVHPAIKGRCPVALELAIGVLFDHQQLGECDTAGHWRSGTAAKLLGYALAVYSDIAGWEQNREQIAAFEAWWQQRRRRAA